MADTSEAIRKRIARAKRIVVKIGSSSLTGPHHRVDPLRIDALVNAMQQRFARGTEIIVVSSGAVAAGMGPLGLDTRPTDLATKQAVAAVGQVHLMHTWGASFARFGQTIGQVLLTASDAGSRDRARNAQQTIEKLLRLGVVPIVNENDTVATTEMRFGDNDRLAALVAHLSLADALFLLSDVDGLYDKNPSENGARFIDAVRDERDLNGVIAGAGGAVGTGGMASKVQASRIATRGGVPVLLTSAAYIGDALDDAGVGTVFHPQTHTLSAWKSWALYAADSGGTIHIDAGAVAALSTGKSSLLPVGITQVEGIFHAGEIVDILGPQGQLVGRGEVAYESSVIESIMGLQTCQLEERRPVVHANHLSLDGAMMAQE
ncbi:glutamate 5-kinase [Corynebacterium sp. ES2715-CONJ3]|uniref:glutamate 5-kinase n=1 Tax=Corynebacterium sp. ES2715-CONJ3 TaxID=2974028 RepID=UPI00216849A7|nr:glutamate 5-kinase [Corynebacterium sp. ES2715-CONJ3]MCS4492289.1 glutamate 5-kinase [Corynebacterium sp. ES2715-CONJ3]